MIYFKNFMRAKTLHTKNVAACNGFSITEPPHSFGTEGLNIFSVYHYLWTPKPNKRGSTAITLWRVVIQTLSVPTRD